MYKTMLTVFGDAKIQLVPLLNKYAKSNFSSTSKVSIN